MENQTQELKILPQFFRAVKEGRKRFEIRKNDRNFQIGDTVWLHEYTKGEYTGNSINIGRIDYVLRSEEAMGLEKGYVIFSTDSLPNVEK